MVSGPKYYADDGFGALNTIPMMALEPQTLYPMMALEPQTLYRMMALEPHTIIFGYLDPLRGIRSAEPVPSTAMNGKSNGTMTRIARGCDNEDTKWVIHDFEQSKKRQSSSVVGACLRCQYW